MLTEEQKNELIKKKEELKKELKIINKKLRYRKCNEYQQKDENKILCECCNKKISKYAYKNHINSKTHILYQQINNVENKV